MSCWRKLGKLIFFYSVTFKQLFDCFVYTFFNIQCLIYDYDDDYCYRCIFFKCLFIKNEQLDITGGTHLHKMLPPVSPYTKANPKSLKTELNREI